MAHALERSFSALLVPLFFLGLMCICMAGIIYYVEGVRRTPHAAPAPPSAGRGARGAGHGARGVGHCAWRRASERYAPRATPAHAAALAAQMLYENEDFDNIFKAAWFVIVTLSTVGYGDISPVSPLGKFLTVPIIVAGLLFMAMPISIVGNNFTVIWEERQVPHPQPQPQSQP